MALSFETYIQYGAQALYPIPFPYLDRARVKVFFDGAGTSDFIFETDSTLRLTTVPPGGTEVTIRRRTDSASRLIDFQDGSTLTEKDLDTDSNQMFYLCQEAADRADQSIALVGGVFDAQGRRIANVGDPVGDMDAVNERTLGARYPDILKVAPYVTAIESVAKDLTSLSLYEMDLGSVASPPSYNAGGSLSTIKVCADNMALISTVSSNIAALQAVNTNLTAIQGAGTNATNAANSASASANSATNAATSAATATTKAANAATSETNALASKNAAATSATNAATSEANALASKNAAATSATNAANSATAAANSATLAASYAGAPAAGSVTSSALASTIDLGALP